MHFLVSVRVMICLLLAAGISFGNGDPSSASVVSEFYEYHFSHDMGFLPASVMERSAWLTPELLEACKSYFAQPQNPDEPPFINGDPFTGTQEYPTDFEVGTADILKTSARVPVTFSWKEVRA